MSKYFLILDIGGTKTAGALFTPSGEIADDYILVADSQTFKGEEAVYRNVKSVLDSVMRHFGTTTDDIIGIGVGSPGPLNTKTGVIIHAPLMGWRNFPVVERLSADFGKPVSLDNDGNLGALAEQRCGVAKGARNMLYMTVSTGCGGGVIINGEIYHGKNDGAGEFGHFSIDPNGLECPCGSRGCFELYASGSALLSQMRRDMEGGVKSKAFELAGTIENLSGNFLNEAAECGDEYARALYEREGYFLGVGIANLFNLYDPELIVLGGGVTKARKFFSEKLMKTLRERCIQPITDESVRYSVMNDRVVLTGAYYQIKDKTKEM